MNVLLANANPSIHFPIYPYGLDCIAAKLRKDHNVKIAAPFIYLESPIEKFSKEVKEFAPDIIGLGIRNIDSGSSVDSTPGSQLWGSNGKISTAFYLQKIKELVTAIRSTVRYSAPIIAGGAGFSVMPEQILSYMDLEYGIIGAGEIPFTQFVSVYPDKKKLSKIHGLIYREGTKYIYNPSIDYDMPIFEVDNFVRDDGFDFFFSTDWGFPIRTRRGCNRDCIYCVEPFIDNNKIHFRKIKKVIDEIRINHDRKNFHTVYFVDSEFNVPDESYSTDLCDALIKSGLSRELQFKTQLTISPFSARFAEKLKKSNFTIIGFTADSYADDVLKKSGKNFRQKDIRKAVDIAKNSGLTIVISMLFGLPGETQQTINESLDFVLSNPDIYFEIGAGARVYPCTKLASMISNKQLIGNWYGIINDNFFYPNCFCAPISPEDLMNTLVQTLQGYSNVIFIWHKGMKGKQYNFYIRRNLSGFYADRGLFEEALYQYKLMTEIQNDPEMQFYISQKLLSAGCFDLLKKLYSFA